jgi:photosynthetic reaction center cytochrome c subunit
MMTPSPRRLVVVLAAALVACEGGAKDEVQLGYRGLGEEQVVDRSQYAALRGANHAPAPLPPAGPSVPGQWQNVQVLTDISANEMTRTMQAMTEWVSPQQGCAYCHVTTNFAVDSPSTKIAARQMLRMVREINSNWRVHVKGTGVTCYTCHRGNPVPPAGLWHLTDRNQVERAFLDRADARVQSYTVEPTADNRSSIKQTENTYALMIKLSTGLGVNCTYCHNSRSWETWNQGPPARLTAQSGLRMVRYLNSEHVAPLNSVLAPDRLGPLGDAPKLQCQTCHNGVNRPLFGDTLVASYPGLWGHAGPWNARLPGDTASEGVRDLRRTADLIPTDASPVHPPLVPHSRPAPGAARGQD